MEVCGERAQALATPNQARAPLNPFEPPTDRTRDLGANDEIEIPDEEEAESGEAQPGVTKETPK